MSAVLQWSTDMLWTPDDVQRLWDEHEGEFGPVRFEIVDGQLVVSPAPPLPHQRIVSRLQRELWPALPTGVEVVGEVWVDIAPTYRLPDVNVVHERGFARKYHDGSDILLAVEVESPSSVTTDRITKPAEYAAIGIGHYWRAEVEPLRLHAYQLRGGAYVEVGSWSRGETVSLEQPFPISFAMDDLLPL